MNSLIEVHEDIVVDFQTITPQILDQLKTFTFFLFYLNLCEQDSGGTAFLQKLSFKIREDKENPSECFRTDIIFCELDCDAQLEQTLFILKQQQFNNNKTKVVVYGYESSLTDLIARADSYGVDVNNLPFVLYSPGLHNDLAQFIGWSDLSLNDLSRKPTKEFEQYVRQWIKSPTEKIDVWEVSVSVDEEIGSIYKMDPNGLQQVLIEGKEFQSCFLSHFSIGYHPRLALDYEVKRKSDNSTIVNHFIYRLESFKKFCCVGSPNVKAATGIVNVNFKNSDGHEVDILKEFCEEEEEQGNTDLRNRKQKNRILTIAICNIDRYHGQKLQSKRSRMNDNKLELITFQSQTAQHELTKVQGKIKLKLESDREVFIQIGNSCYRLLHPRQIVVKFQRKIKILMNRDILGC